MVIDRETYKLPENNYYSTEFKKRQIILGNTFSEKHNHINGWLSRLSGEYKKTSMYTIDRKGVIYEHFNPNSYSDFTGNKSVDKKATDLNPHLVNQHLEFATQDTLQGRLPYVRAVSYQKNNKR